LAGFGALSRSIHVDQSQWHRPQGHRQFPFWRFLFALKVCDFLVTSCYSAFQIGDTFGQQVAHKANWNGALERTPKAAASMDDGRLSRSLIAASRASTISAETMSGTAPLFLPHLI
jgi:hypothetical protein